jgi:hypothetical protein
MPRIPDNYLESVIYLYASEQGAKEGRNAGGSGFIVGVPSAWPNRAHLYAVTNRHVIETGYSVIRLNLVGDKKTDVREYQDSDWTLDDEHDLAVLPLDLSEDTHKARYVHSGKFLTSRIAFEKNIGVGDEVFMVGRFINASGKQQNYPTARCGNIAMMPHEPIPNPFTARGQNSFLIEVRTLQGYSGSPVFVYVPIAEILHKHPGADPLSGEFGPWLLGVEWGHIKGEREELSGLAGVVPAWKLLNLINREDLTMTRKIKDDDLAKELKDFPTSVDVASKKQQSSSSGVEVQSIS